MVDLALAICFKNKNVSTLMLGARKPSQLEENFKCLAVARKLDQKTMDIVEKILENKPTQNFMLWKKQRVLKASI